MIVTFPHFGPLTLSLAQFFSSLDIPFVIPPEHGADALKKGAEISPEEMCAPFKIMVGNLISACECGADTAVMVATCGPCRLGEYGQLMMEVLKQAGYDLQWILLDSVSDIGAAEFVRRFRKLTEEDDISNAVLMIRVLQSIKMIRRRDLLQRRAAKKAGYLKDPYEAVRILHETDEVLKSCGSFEECFKVIKKAEHRLLRLPERKNADPVKVLVSGEIYTSIEKEGNKGAEETLMKLGCSVERHIDLTWWIIHSLRQAILPERLCSFFGGKGRIPCTVGGYGKETADRIMKSRGYDGIIKLMPSGCMPEIVTKAFCETLQKNEELHILHLIFDEMDGNAGYETRIEAFTDMLERRKDVLAGNRYRLHKYGSGFDR